MIDASAVVEILRRTPAGQDLAGTLSGQRLHAPHVLDLEVANALRKLVSLNLMTQHESDQAIETFLAIPILRYAHVDLLTEIWELRHNLTAYDAAYLALSWALDAPLITMDEGLRKRAARRR